MKKVILTISALLVSAAMVFSFAGCTGNEPKEPDTDVAAVTEADTAVEADATEADTAVEANADVDVTDEAATV